MKLMWSDIYHLPKTENYTVVINIDVETIKYKINSINDSNDNNPITRY